MQLLGIAFALASVVAGEELLQEMCGSRNGFFVVPAVGCDHARDACARSGGRLADITIENVLKASRVAISRNGPYTSSWVASWNGDKYEGACLALSVGSSGAGALNVLPGCRSHKMALCERVADCGCQKHKKCRKCRTTKFVTRTVDVFDPTTSTVFVTVSSTSTSVSTSLSLTTSSDSTTLTLTATSTTISTDGTSETVTLTSTTTLTDPTTITSTALTATTSTTVDTSTIFSTDSTTLTDTATTTSTETDLTTTITGTTTTTTTTAPGPV